MVRTGVITFPTLTGVGVGDELTSWMRCGEVKAGVLDANLTMTGAATLQVFLQTTDDPTAPAAAAAGDLIWEDGVDPPTKLLQFTATGRKWRSVSPSNLRLAGFFRFRKNLSAGVTSASLALRFLARLKTEAGEDPGGPRAPGPQVIGEGN